MSILKALKKVQLEIKHEYSLCKEVANEETSDRKQLHTQYAADKV